MGPGCAPPLSDSSSEGVSTRSLPTRFECRCFRIMSRRSFRQVPWWLRCLQEVTTNSGGMPRLVVTSILPPRTCSICLGDSAIRSGSLPVRRKLASSSSEPSRATQHAISRTALASSSASPKLDEAARAASFPARRQAPGEVSVARALRKSASSRWAAGWNVLTGCQPPCFGRSNERARIQASDQVKLNYLSI